MFAKPEDLLQSPQAAFDTAVLLARTGFENAERLTALNLNVARSAFEDTIAAVHALLEVRDPQALIKLQTELAQPAIEKALAYSRNVYEITSQAKESVGKVVESQVADTNAQVIKLVDKGLKSAPVGSEAAVAAVKSAITAANNAYEGLTQAARQVNELTDASIAAASESVSKVSAVVAPAAAPRKTKKAA